MLLNQRLVQKFVAQAISYGDYEYEDAIYIQNKLLSNLNAEGVDDSSVSELNKDATANEITQYWIRQAINENCIEDALDSKEKGEAEVLDVITSRPSVINSRLEEAYETSPIAATDYFYEMDKGNNDVKEDEIDKIIN